MTAPKRSLEKDLQRLQEIVELLERKDLELEQAIALFEEGTGLVREAERLLAQAEGRLRQLVELEGEGRLVDLSLPADDAR